MPNNTDAPEVLETPVTETETPIEPQAEPAVETPDETEQLRKDLEAEREKNKKLFARAKKAEAEKGSLSDGLTVLDGLAIQGAGIDHEEDIQEAIDFAAYKKIPVREALKQDALKAILKDRAETRRTAAANQTRSPRSAPSVSHDTFIQRAREGNVKETDIDKLTEARMEARTKK